MFRWVNTAHALFTTYVSVPSRDYITVGSLQFQDTREIVQLACATFGPIGATVSTLPLFFSPARSCPLRYSTSTFDASRVPNGSTYA